MPSLRKSDKVVAVLCADLHLASKPPRCRANEPDWFEAMARSLKQIDDLAHSFNVPVICAGDIFDRWHSSPELINFALKYLPTHMFTIHGQHDVSYHRGSDMFKSAYGVLLRTHRIRHLNSMPIGIGSPGVSVYGYSWGETIQEPAVIDKAHIKIAVIHKFIWGRSDTGYKGVLEIEHISNYTKALKDYDVAVFGDNHKGFIHRNSSCLIFNCGTMMRRTIKEFNYQPRLGLLYDNGFVEIVYLDTSDDKFIYNTNETESTDDSAQFDDFISTLESMERDPLNFESVIRRYIKTCKKEAAEVIMDVLEHYNG